MQTNYENNNEGKEKTANIHYNCDNWITNYGNVDNNGKQTEIVIIIMIIIRIRSGIINSFNNNGEEEEKNYVSVYFNCWCL